MRNEAQYRATLTESGVPSHMHDGYVLYLLRGIRPGHFLTAVIENDLYEALARADDDNRAALYQHVAFLYRYAPAACWGSPSKVRAWVVTHREQREQQTA